MGDFLAGEFAHAVEVCPAPQIRLIEDEWDGWVRVRVVDHSDAEQSALLQLSIHGDGNVDFFLGDQPSPHLAGELVE